VAIGKEARLKYTIELEKGRYHSVSIQSASLDLPLVDLSLSAKSAWALIQALQARQAEIRDMAENYYDCSDCGETHHNGETCATDEEDEEDDE